MTNKEAIKELRQPRDTPRFWQAVRHSLATLERVDRILQIEGCPTTDMLLHYLETGEGL